MKTVWDMRVAQKEYFRTRSQAALSKSKGLERLIDKMIEDSMNPNLFNDGKG